MDGEAWLQGEEEAEEERGDGEGEEGGGEESPALGGIFSMPVQSRTQHCYSAYKFKSISKTLVNKVDYTEETKKLDSGPFLAH